MKYTAFFLSASAISLLASPALAQEQDAPQDSNMIVVTAQENNETIISAAGNLGVLGDKSAEDVPFVIRSYDETLIYNQQPQTLGEVLENDPSVRTSYGFGNASEQFVIRGFTLFGDDVGVNGLYGIAPRQLVAPELFSQVQVLNGATAFLNGAAPGGSGIGGSVNLVMKRAGDKPLTRVTANYTSDQHFGGSFDVARRFGEGDAFGIRINGAYRGGDVSVDDEYRSNMVFGAGLDWRSDTIRVGLDVGYQKVKVNRLRPKVTIGTNAIPEVPNSDDNYAQDWTYSDMRDIFGALRVEVDVADNAMFYVNAGARDGSEDGIYSSITVNDAVTGAAKGGSLYVPRSDNNEAAEAGFRVKLGSAITQEINIGGNISWQNNRNAFDFLGGFAGFDTNLYNTPQVALPGTGFVGGNLDDLYPRTKTRLWSAFASDTFGFWNDRILITGGLRLQNIKVSNFGLYDGGQLESVYDENAITPVAGVVIKPVDGVSLYANRIEGLQQGPVAPLDATLSNPGQVFAPYRSTQYEIGGKLSFGVVDAGIALYQIDLPSAYAVPLDANNPAGLQVFGVFGEQRNKGLEFTLNAEPTQGLRLFGGFTLVDATIRKSNGDLNLGNDVQGVPDYTVNANAEWDIPFLRGFTLTGRMVLTGEQQVNAANTLQIGNWSRFDVGARYVFAAGDMPVTLRFTVDNVADSDYWASAFDAFNSALLQGRPRTFKASLSTDF